MLAKALQSAAGNAAEATYIEDVFSTYLYTGTGSTQTITNGIDLSGEGGLVWLKARSAPYANELYDTVRGAGNLLESQSTNAAYQFSPVNSGGVSAFGATGFTLGSRQDANNNGTTFTSWTFRKAEKFFDVVTYTGNGTTQNISHNLGSVPGCIIVKRINNASNTGWPVYHRYNYQSHGFLNLANNFTGAQEETWFGNNLISVAPTSTVFTVGSNQDINASSNTYVAYLFAHDAGGFGDDGSENVISCGSYTEGSSDVAVTLGYEPAWIMVKPVSTSGNWNIYDTMRGAALTGNTAILRPNTADAEVNAGNYWQPTATGFVAKAGNFGSGVNMIYIAIRRGPMKPPESGTEVFSPVAYSGTGTNSRAIASSITPDSVFFTYRDTTSSKSWYTRLQGNGNGLASNSTNAEFGVSTLYGPQFNSSQTGYVQGTGDGVLGGMNASGYTFITYLMRRAPGFFDVVCYTGTGSATTVAHNLTVAPEMMIVKRRDATSSWPVYAAPIGNTKRLILQTTDMSTSATTYWNSTSPTSSDFTVATNSSVNASGGTYVAYLFGTVAGVSKVGSYTGTGTTQQINCGFTGGARFVLIKRTDSTGDWYVWDSARGIVAGNDPYLLLNSTAAEVTTTDYVDTYSAGFEISSTAPAAINANGGSFIFFAVA